MRRLAFLVVVVPALARADLRSGDEQFLHGDYSAAIEAYREVKGRDAAAAQVRLGRVQLQTGDVAGAAATAAAAVKAADRGVAEDAKVLLAEVYCATGRAAEARALLEDIAKKSPKNLRARAQLGLLYRDIGETRLAAKVWNQFYDDHDAGTLDKTKAENLVYLAMAARYLEDFHGANDTLQEAVAKDPKIIAANLEWGSLFLDKYNAADAETSFDEVLKIDPKNPDAHAGLARVKVEQNYDYRGAEAEIDKALAANPNQPMALAIRAELQIDNSEFAAADKTLARILAVNPQDLAALTLQAAIAWLTDDAARLDAVKKRVFAQNGTYARLYHVIADFAVKVHRYKEAIALEEEALRLDPKYSPALAGIGTGYLRMGDETNGRKYLEEAAKRDAFNVRTYNILNLFEDTIPQRYVMFSAGKVFRFRVAKDEKAMLERYVPRLLDKAWAEMVKRYGYTPQTPVTIELFNDPDHYSVRTVGLPNLGALGVCFGQVITALAPSNGNVNWGMILWHELGHVFAIQMSNSRVPRWFTEGLSEVETILARKEWRRENDVDIWQAYARNQLPSVVDLNARFLRADDMNDMVVAYHLSSVTVEFIVRQYGFSKIVEGLKRYAQGKSDADAIKAMTGLAVADFDREFRAYLDRRLAVYRGSFKVEVQRYGDLKTLEIAAAAKPQDASVQADLAIAYLAAEKPEKAGPAVDAALKLDGKNTKALWAAAELAIAKGDAAAGKARLGELIAAGGDGYDARMRLAGLAVEGGDLKEAEAQWQKAKTLDPERSEPSMRLYDVYAKTNREDQALAELERYVMIEQMEYAPLKKLVDKLAAKKAWAKVRDYGEMALFINPYDAELHLTLGDAHAALGAADAAAFEYESALLADPPLRRPAVVQIGLARAQLMRKDTAAAKKAVAEALRLEPDNVEAQELAKKLGVARPR
ncbi:MAG TPA: tetratricopeptide repeat protein [Haliangiales bacterium]|nr:tetratricopeptide repeat protein [Haliangiales bacterium]